MLPTGCVLECRGCKHREWKASESHAQKYQYLASKLSEWHDILAPIRTVPAFNRLGYRNRTVLSTLWLNNQWLFGMYVKDQLIPIHNCPVHAPVINRTIKILSESLPYGNAFPMAFFIQTGSQVALILKTKEIFSDIWLTEKVKTALSGVGIEGLWVHFNPSAGRRLFEKTPLQLLFGKDKSRDVDGFIYSIGAFQQLIPKLYNHSLDEVENFFKPTQEIAIVDLYCGIGKSVKRWLNFGSEVLGVEQNGSAIDCAKINVPGALILRGACRQRIPQIQDWVSRKRDEQKSVFLYVNPPRTGVEPDVLSWIVKKGMPEKIAYLSCSPGTLYKNLKFLQSYGYQVVQLIPFDFFPQTIHVECLALIERKDN